MQLIIKRDQSQVKGFFGGNKGMKFLLSCQARLTPEEQNLIAKYKAEDELLAGILIEGDTNQSGPLFIKNLVAGKAYECKNVLTLLDIENKIKEACKNFNILLSVMASFGGEEIVEF